MTSLFVDGLDGRRWSADAAVLRESASGDCAMFGTTVLKYAASVVLVAATAGGTGNVEYSPSAAAPREEVPVAFDSSSLLVATLADGAVQTHWMSRVACERVAEAVAAGNSVAGVRGDGVKIYIVRANCSTRQVPVDPAISLSSIQPQN